MGGLNSASQLWSFERGKDSVCDRVLQIEGVCDALVERISPNDTLIINVDHFYRDTDAVFVSLDRAGEHNVSVQLMSGVDDIGRINVGSLRANGNIIEAAEFCAESVPDPHSKQLVAYPSGPKAQNRDSLCFASIVVYLKAEQKCRDTNY